MGKTRFRPPRKKFKFNRSIFLIPLAILLSSTGFLAYKFLLPQFKLQTFGQDGVHFQYPNDWEIWEGLPDLTKHMPTAQIIFIKNNRQSTSFGIKMESMVGSKLNIEESSTVLETRLREATDDFEKVDYQNPTVSGEKAIDYTFKYSVKEAQSTGGWSKWYGMQRQVIFFKSRTLYYLIFTSEPEDFGKDSKDFDIILKRFRVE